MLRRRIRPAQRSAPLKVVVEQLLDLLPTRLGLGGLIRQGDPVCGC